MFPLGVALFVEAFVTIHMSIFVLLPLSKIFSENNSSKLFWKLFIIRIAILLFCDFFVTPTVAMIDFLGVFAGVFLIVPISAFLRRKNLSNVMSFQTSRTYTQKIYHIDNNGNLDKYENVDIPQLSTSNNDTSPVVKIDMDYLNSENVLMGNIIKKEIINQDENPKTLTTPELNSKKNLVILIYGVLTALFIVMYKYYKYPLYVSIFGEIVSTIAFIILMYKYDVVNAIYEYSKKNPDSEIFQIVTSVKDRKKFGVIPDYIKIVTVLAIAIIMPILLIP